MTPIRSNVYPIEVTVLYGADCAGIDPLIDLINELADQLHVQVSVKTVLVNSSERAITLRSLGSPTVQVDGLDVEPSARRRKDYSHG